MGGVYLTDGVKYIMDNGYAWFVSDAVATIIAYEPVREYYRRENFLAIKLKAHPESNTADLYIEDGNGHVLYQQHYSFSDAKVDITLFFSDNVLMLSQEW